MNADKRATTVAPLAKYKLIVDKDMRERLTQIRFDFPYSCSVVEIDNYVDGYVPWHWHIEPEFCIVIEGEVDFYLGNRIFFLSAGDAIFIYSNTRHMMKPLNICYNALFLSHTFNKYLLIGYNHSSFDNKYYRPITNSKALPNYLICGEKSAAVAMVR